MKQKYHLIFGIITLLVIILAGCAQKVDIENSEGNEKEIVYWDESIKILNSGQVAVISQAHNLDVVFKLKNGKSIYTKEPSIDDIFEEVEKCGSSCQNIALATE